MPDEQVKNSLRKILSSLSPNEKALVLKNRDKAKKKLREVRLF
jgi:hypothetical protein